MKIKTYLLDKKERLLGKNNGGPSLSLILTIVILILIVKIISISNTKTYIVTIEDTYSVDCVSDSNTYYFIKAIDENGNEHIFKDNEELFRNKINSPSIYYDLETGEKYELEVFGYNIKFLNSYENVNSYKTIED